MNELEKHMMDAPSLKRPWCVVCGKPATNLHHVVPRSHGGSKGPVLSLCGMGNASGCHGRAHEHTLSFRYREGWEVLETDRPTKYQAALEMEGWRKVDTAGME